MTVSMTTSTAPDDRIRLGLKRTPAPGSFRLTRRSTAYVSIVARSRLRLTPCASAIAAASGSCRRVSASSRYTVGRDGNRTWRTQRAAAL